MVGHDGDRGGSRARQENRRSRRTWASHDRFPVHGSASGATLGWHDLPTHDRQAVYPGGQATLRSERCDVRAWRGHGGTGLPERELGELCVPRGSPSAAKCAPEPARTSTIKPHHECGSSRLARLAVIGSIASAAISPWPIPRDPDSLVRSRTGRCARAGDDSRPRGAMIVLVDPRGTFRSTTTGPTAARRSRSPRRDDCASSDGRRCRSWPSFPGARASAHCSDSRSRRCEPRRSSSASSASWPSTRPRGKVARAGRSRSCAGLPWRRTRSISSSPRPS